MANTSASVDLLQTFNIKHAETSGQPLEPAMTSMSPSQAISTARSSSSAAPAEAQRRDEIDWEERRWQMEWDRRNVED